jgi:signal transduction histidine kinase
VSLRRYVRAHLHRRLFLWFGASIAATALTLFCVFHFLERITPSPWQQEAQRVSAFVGNRFAAVWSDATARQALAAAIAQDLELSLTLVDEGGHTLDRFGACASPQYRVPVLRDGAALGHVDLCMNRSHAANLWRVALPFLAAAIILWGASGRLARRLTRPLVELARVARDIGNGKLESRARLRWRGADEVGALAESINDMAAKIQKQMAEQRELLAGVSHELRTPLTRMRVLIELAKNGTHTQSQLQELDREIGEIDALVGELLASAKLDFSALRLHTLDARAVVLRALERAGESPALLTDDSVEAHFSGDAALLARALANLFDNAKKHGGGVRGVRIKTRAGRVAFEVEDAGVGFSEEAARRLFQPFAGGQAETSSLGLGLALVRRIAEAHGGTAYADNRASGGARVGFEVNL